MPPTPHFSVLQSGLCIHGDVVGDHGMTCLGLVDGNVTSTQGLLHIGPGAVVRGTVEGEHVLIDGTVEGDVKARTSLHVNGRVKGRIIYGGTIRLGTDADLEGATITRAPVLPFSSAHATDPNGSPGPL